MVSFFEICHHSSNCAYIQVRDLLRDGPGWTVHGTDQENAPAVWYGTQNYYAIFVALCIVAS